jgi:hypothetical protein
VGTTVIKPVVSGPGQSNFDITLTNGSYEIKKATPTINISGGPFTYDGNSHAATVTVTGVGGVTVAGSSTVNYAGVPPTSYGPSTTAPTNAGTYAVRVVFTSSDNNYNGTQNSGSIVINKATTSLLYNGMQVVTAGSVLTVSATLSSSAPLCKSSQQIAFSLDDNPTTETIEVLSFSLVSGLTSSAGLAKTNYSGTAAWLDGVYTIKASFAGSANCEASYDDVTLTVVIPGDSATGGGWYTLQGNGRVNFGFTVRRIPNSTPAAYKGQILVHNNGKWRFKGTLNSFGLTGTAGNQGIVGGTGNLYIWDPTLNGGLGDWALVSSPVSITASFQDSGSGGKNSLDMFGVQINFPAGVPNSLAVQLKGGDVTIQK